MKKKLLSVLLIGVLLISLTGCGSETAKDGTNNNKSTTNGLASKVKVGDYVNYQAEKGKTYTATKDKTGYDKDQTFEVTGEEKWRVMNINKDGTIDLILDGYAKTIIDSGLRFKGQIGVDNYKNELNNIAQIYANSNYATSSRIISKKDLENMLDIDATVKYFLKTYDAESSLYTRDENIDTSGSKEDVLNSISKTYYSSMTGHTYGDKIKLDNQEVTFNRSYIMNNGLNECITDENYKSLINNSWAVWLYGDVETLIAHDLNWNSDYIDYDLPRFSYDSKLNTYKYISENIYKLYLKGSDGAYTKGESFEYSVDGNIKPIVTLKANIELSSGDGSESSPWILK